MSRRVWVSSLLLAGALALSAGCQCPLDARLDDINARADTLQLAIDQSGRSDAGRLSADLRRARQMGTEARSLASRAHYEATEEQLDAIEAALAQ